MISRSWPLLLLALAACPGRLDDPERFKACMLDVETEIFAPKCGQQAGCHSAVSPSNGLDLVSAGVKMRIATGTSTCSGKSLKAFIAEKLTEMPSCGSPMPNVGDPLTPAEHKCVLDYLAAIGTDGGS